MQAFRLVLGGEPDRIIVFDTLPADLMASVKSRTPTGLPRHWTRWLQEIGSVDRDGKPCFFLLDYLMVNQDKQSWQNIAQYARRTVDTKFRLLDRMEDMAKPMAKDSRTELSLEPEDIVIIPIPKEELEPAGIAAGEPEPVPVRKRRKEA